MAEYTGPIAGIQRDRGTSRFGPAVVIIAPLLAILFKVYVPQLIPQLAYLSLPLLVVVYLAIMRRSPVRGVLFGAAVGLVQDSLSHQPIGMFGIVLSLVGYFAASISMRFEVGNAVLRFVLSFFFYFFHEFFYWVMARALLGQAVEFHPQQALIVGALNAVVAIPLFHMLDRLKVTE